jgi:hypothetical protein
MIDPRSPCYFLIREVPDTKDVQFSLCFDLKAAQARIRTEGFRAFQFANEVFLEESESGNV